jgi:hypothetical protein
MATASGTTFAPSALDPYPIETELAKTAYNQPEQQSLMDQYWFERQANKNLYGQEIGMNRELQQQQMQNALQQEFIKQYHNAAQDPGVAEALQGAGAGFTPQVLDVLQRNAAAKAQAENLSKYGTAASGLSTAGMGADALTANTGLEGFGVRPDIQIANINAAAKLAAARLHGSGAKEDSVLVPIGGSEYDIVDPSGQVLNTGLKMKLNTPPEVAAAKIAQARALLGSSVSGHPGIPGAPTPQDGAPPPASTSSSGGGATRLAPSATAAKPATPTGTSAAPAAVPLQDTPAKRVELGTTPQGIALQQRAHRGLPTLPAAKRAEIDKLTAGMGNNVPVVVRGGVPYYVDAKGGLIIMP